MKTLITQLILILFCGTLFAQSPSGKENIPTSNADFEKEMMSLINAFRKKHSLGALEWNESLAKAARYHAKDMFEDWENLFDNPDWVTSDKDFALMSAIWFWNKNKLNVQADSGDIKLMTKKINGGYIGLEDRIHHYEDAIKLLT